MTDIVKRIATASIELITGSFEVTGAVTASKFLGRSDPGVSFVGSSSFALNTDSASAALNSISASLATNVRAAPLLIPIPSFLDQLKLLNIEEPIDPIEGAVSILQFDLANHKFSRLGATITNGETTLGGTPRIAIQYSLDGNDPWNFLDGVGGPYVDITGSATGSIRTVGPLSIHATESFTNVVLRSVTYSGSATPPFESPTVFAVYLFFLPTEGDVF